MRMKSLLLLSIVSAAIVVGLGAFAPNALANHTHLAGFAWSGDDMGSGIPTGGVGWIALSCHHEFSGVGDVCATSDFGVLMNDLDSDPSTVELEGYMWSGDNCGDADPLSTCGIGWISLNRSETGVPPGPPYDGAGDNFIARYNPATGRFYGWGRAVVCNGNPACGGWDGWIKLSNLDGSDAGASHGVIRQAAASCNLAGHAWGGRTGALPGTEVIGWVSFQENFGAIRLAQLAPSQCGLILPPTLIARTNEIWCQHGVELSWDYVDFVPPNNMDAYQVQVCTNRDCDPPAAIVWDTGPLDGNANPIIPVPPPFPPAWSPPVELCKLESNFAPLINTGSLCGQAQASALATSTQYWWRVRAHEPGSNEWSAWAFSGPFTTPPHNFPTSQFTFFPVAPFANEEVQFTDQSTQFVSNPNGAACDDGTVTPADPTDDCVFTWNFNRAPSDPLVSYQCVVPSAACEVAQNPRIMYALGNNSSHSVGVELDILDSDGHDCAKEIRPLTVAPELPPWIEISPR